MATLFVGTTVVSVALGAKYDPLYGFMFFGAICMIAGLAEVVFKSVDKK